jgi:hypothetical protein
MHLGNLKYHKLAQPQAVIMDYSRRKGCERVSVKLFELQMSTAMQLSQRWATFDREVEVETANARARSHWQVGKMQSVRRKTELYRDIAGLELVGKSRSQPYPSG